jgi:hypothetical protein
MATTAQLNQFPSTADAGVTGQGFLSRLLHRVMIAGEARAIYRLERDYSHMLGDDHIKQIKADFAVRKASADL